MAEPLSERDREVLEILIADYIATAAPVGSMAISKKHMSRSSSATIRSIMADLEQMGFLSQPHTSAGRIPTAMGFRFYVDSILKYRDLSPEEKDEVYSRYFNEKDLSVEEMLGRTSRALSSISRCVGLVGTSSLGQMLFKQIEFIPLSRGRLLGIFVSQEGFVQNKIVEISEEYTYTDLEKINNYCNSAFMGLSLDDARSKIARELELIEKDYDNLLKHALLFSKELFNVVGDADLLFNGESHLLEKPEFSDVDKLKNLLRVLEEKKQILHLLDRSREAGGVRIFIGQESGIQLGDGPGINEAIESVSVVAAPFRKGGRVLGTLGVIGPMRMDYSRVVPIVDFTAKMLEDLLS